jgi:hypothetical protein
MDVIIYLCQEGMGHKIKDLTPLENFKNFLKSLLTNPQIYDTICIQGKGNQTKVKKKDLKKSKKVLDKPHKVWYNKDTKRTGTSGK